MLLLDGLVLSLQHFLTEGKKLSSWNISDQPQPKMGFS